MNRTSLRVAGVILIALCFLLMQFLGEPHRQIFIRTYYACWIFWIQLPLGALFVQLIFVASGSNRTGPLESQLARVSSWLPLLSLAFLPICLQSQGLYSAVSSLESGGRRFLFQPWVFASRSVVIFLIWIAMAFIFRQAIPRLKASGQRKNLRIMAAFFLIAHCLLSTFAAIDWIMALEPEWHSTSIGFIFLSQQALAGLCAGLLSLSMQGDLPPQERLVDFGSLLQTAVIFSAYLAFCQYLMAWYGNLPDRTVWYLHRIEGDWKWHAAVVVVLQWIIPFLLLLPRANRGSLRFLGGLSLALLILRFIDTYGITVAGALRGPAETPLYHLPAIALSLGIAASILKLRSLSVEVG